MYISAQDYLKRISHALEHVAAPQITSDHARGQVLAAVFLLEQLMDRIDYKPDLVSQEIEMSFQTIRKVVKACGERAGDVPADLKEFLAEMEGEARGQSLKLRDRCDRMLSAAVDFFFANRDHLDPKLAREINGDILKQFKVIGARNLGMLKLSTSGKLIQTKDRA